MLLGIVSDTHCRYENVAKALGLLTQRDVACVLHCGDIEDEQTVRLFADLPTHFVFGNCDTERERLREAIRATGATLHEPYGDLELEGRKIAFLHGDDKRLMRDLEQTGFFDFLFHGHTHQAGEYRIGPTRVINPGALHRARPKTILVLDLPSGTTESLVVE